MKKLFINILLSLYTMLVYGQVLNPTVGSNIRVFPSTHAQSEVQISINKTRPQNILISANTTDLNQGWYVSNDGGVTWPNTTCSDKLPNSGNGTGDPSTSFDANGRGYIVTMSPFNSSGKIDGYLVQRTDDFGITWSNQVRGEGPTNDFDKEMATTFDEMQPSATANNFYCAWTDFGSSCRVRFNRSTDGGLNFTDLQDLSSSSGHGTNVQTGPDGEVYVCWADYKTGGCPSGVKAQRLGFSFSNDGGVNFTSSFPFSYHGIREDCNCGNGTCNSGNSYNNTRVNDFPSMAIDKSCGQHRGRIYVATPEFDANNSNHTVINVRYSDNNGLTWSSATVVSLSTCRRAFEPWIVVDDETGLVNVAYLCFDQSTGFQTNTYLAYSIDFGSTWSNVKVSDQSHTQSEIGGNFCTGYFGDYIGLASFGGISYVCWPDNRNSTWNIYLAKVDFHLSPTISSATDLVINHPTTLPSPALFQATNFIRVATTNDAIVSSTSNIEMKAGKALTFMPGFIAEAGSVFLAHIESVIPCTTPGAISNKMNLFTEKDRFVFPTRNNISVFSYPNPTSEFITIGIDGKITDNVSLKIFDVKGSKIFEKSTLNSAAMNFREIVDVSSYPEGLYYFIVKSGIDDYSGKFIVSK